MQKSLTKNIKIPIVIFEGKVYLGTKTYLESKNLLKVFPRS